MAYASDYNYLTVHWNLENTGEQGQFGLKFTGATLPDQAMVDGAAAAVSTFWSGSTSYIYAGHTLTFLRLVRVGVDGKYLPGAISYDHVYSPVVQGFGPPSGTVERYPAQASHAVSLRTAVPRGIAHAGRVYLPPMAAVLGSDYKWPTASVNNRLNSFSAMLSTLSGSALGTLRVMSKGTPSHPAGQSNDVTFINSDVYPDVQRRRAKQLPRSLSANFNVT